VKDAGIANFAMYQLKQTANKIIDIAYFLEKNYYTISGVHPKLMSWPFSCGCLILTLGYARGAVFTNWKQ
jgi:hypothetical protein